MTTIFTQPTKPQATPEPVIPEDGDLLLVDGGDLSTQFPRPEPSPACQATPPATGDTPRVDR